MAPFINDSRQYKNPSLKTLVSVFFRFSSPILLLSLFSAFLAIRIYLGQWTWWDAVAIGIVLTFQPFFEWLYHVFVLHFRPKTIGGKQFDLHVAQKHRIHHQEPWRLDTVFIPKRTELIAFGVTFLTWYLLSPTIQVAFTGITWVMFMMLMYEWTHYLTHTNYRPRSKIVMRRWRHHRLHHFKNEHYWQGVVMHLADHILGTAPDHNKVETSPTCRTLGINLKDDQSEKVTNDEV